MSNGKEILCQIFPNPAPEGRTDTLQLSYLPQMLAEYIQYKYIYPTDTCFLTQRQKGAQTLSICNIPQMFAENIQYKNIYSTDTLRNSAVHGSEAE